jgi:hypothetical protein
MQLRSLRRWNIRSSAVGTSHMSVRDRTGDAGNTTAVEADYAAASADRLHGQGATGGSAGSRWDCGRRRPAGRSTRHGAVAVGAVAEHKGKDGRAAEEDGRHLAVVSHRPNCSG